MITVNWANNGGGLFVGPGREVTLTGVSQLVNNSTPNSGGGAFVAGRLNVLGDYAGIGLTPRRTMEAGSTCTAHVTSSGVPLSNEAGATDGRGGGIYAHNGQVVLDDSSVDRNTANGSGGGIVLHGGSLIVTQGSAVSYNTASAGTGGGIHVEGGGDSIADFTVQHNTAGTDGGAVYLPVGTLDMTGHWAVSWNSAGGNGGAIAVTSSGVATLAAMGDSSGGALSYNTAGGNGGAVYLGNESTLKKDATAGSPVHVSSNSASRGGAACTDAGGILNVRGDVRIGHNEATDRGGAFWLQNGSHLWLDDYGDRRPSVWANQASAGGAVYASGSVVDCNGADIGSTNGGNRATGANGGAVRLFNSTLTADNCVFRSNSAAADGGAIAAYTSTVTLDVDYPATTTLALAPVRQDGARGLGAAGHVLQPLLGPMQQSVRQHGGNRADHYRKRRRRLQQRQPVERQPDLPAPQRGGPRRGRVPDRGRRHQLHQQYAGLQQQLVYIFRGRDPGGRRRHHDHARHYCEQCGGSGLFAGLCLGPRLQLIIWGNSVAAFGALAAAVCNIDQGGTAGPAANPLFAAPGGSADLRPLVGSPAIDACNTGLPTDIMNKARPAGVLYDMGAYEGSARRLYLPLASRQ